MVHILQKFSLFIFLTGKYFQVLFCMVSKAMLFNEYLESEECHYPLILVKLRYLGSENSRMLITRSTCLFAVEKVHFFCIWAQKLYLLILNLLLTGFKGIFITLAFECVYIAYSRNPKIIGFFPKWGFSEKSWRTPSFFRTPKVKVT